MERLCKFAVLRYVPNEFREEFINIGLVFHAPEEAFIDLRLTTNFSRVHAFDDEIDINFLKVVLDGVKSEFTQSTVHGPSLKELMNDSYLEQATRTYVNQLQFSPVFTIRSKDIEPDFEDLFKTYVYFDAQKKQRITEDKVKSVMNRVFKESQVFNKLNRNIKVDIGPQEIELDYSYVSTEHQKLIKAFSFDYTERGSKSAPQTAKEWAWNYSKLRELHKTDKELDIITFVYVGKKNKNIDIALEILHEESKKLVQANEQKEIEKFANEITKDLSR